MSTLRERAEAAREILRSDANLDPLLVLSFVLWPSEEVAAAVPDRGQKVTDAEVDRMAALAAQGLSHRAIGDRLGRPRTTVSWALAGHGSWPKPGPNAPEPAHAVMRDRTTSAGL